MFGFGDRKKTLRSGGNALWSTLRTRMSKDMEDESEKISTDDEVEPPAPFSSLLFNFASTQLQPRNEDILDDMSSQIQEPEFDGGLGQIQEEESSEITDQFDNINGEMSPQSSKKA